MSVLQKRRSGILLHPTSLPGGTDGVGTLGKEAYAFIDWMAESGQSVWQILPLNPTGYGDSPYAGFSAFAGNPYLIDLEKLVELGDLSVSDLTAYCPPEGSTERVDYGWLYHNKLDILQKASRNFFENGDKVRKKALANYCDANKDWLDHYALFMSLKQLNGGVSWDRWPESQRKDIDVTSLCKEVDNEYLFFQKYINWQFFEQWAALKQYAASKGVQILGDAPIFVAYDSAEVWANQNLFMLQDNGLPEAVAGVPPDYFSATGQLWGNPLYRWDVMQADGFSWWLNRIGHLLEFVDLVRIDHFRGFAQYWQIPYGEETAINGVWIDAPGEAFFTALKEKFGADLPVVAEDLGLITEDVVALRDSFALPGMRIFEFAPWGDDGFDDNGVWREFHEHGYLPENYPENCVAYLGTHDNDTFMGWYGSLNDKQKGKLAEYLDSPTAEYVHWRSVETLWGSGAGLVVLSVQDLLALGSDSRFNIPGVLGTCNWSWRLSDKQFDRMKTLSSHLYKMSKSNKRCG